MIETNKRLDGGGTGDNLLNVFLDVTSETEQHFTSWVEGESRHCILLIL